MEDIWRTKEKNECPYYSGFDKCAIYGVKKCPYDSTESFAYYWHDCVEIKRMEENATEE